MALKRENEMLRERNTTLEELMDYLTLMPEREALGMFRRMRVVDRPSEVLKRGSDDGQTEAPDGFTTEAPELMAQFWGAASTPGNYAKDHKLVDSFEEATIFSEFTEGIL
jgi:hypothetical protein